MLGGPGLDGSLCCCPCPSLEPDLPPVLPLPRPAFSLAQKAPILGILTAQYSHSVSFPHPLVLASPQVLNVFHQWESALPYGTCGTTQCQWCVL